jgi:hypothetical protein
VRISYDPAKCAATLAERGIDFEDAVHVFAGVTASFVDDRADYGETRVVTAGLLRHRLVIVVWTARGDAGHVISMRKANEREKRRFGQRLGEG